MQKPHFLLIRQKIKKTKLNTAIANNAIRIPIITALTMLVTTNVTVKASKTKAIVKIEEAIIIPLYAHRHFDNAFLLFAGIKRRIVIKAIRTAAITAK